MPGRQAINDHGLRSPRTRLIQPFDCRVAAPVNVKNPARPSSAMISSAVSLSSSMRSSFGNRLIPHAGIFLIALGRSRQVRPPAACQGRRSRGLVHPYLRGNDPANHGWHRKHIIFPAFGEIGGLVGGECTL